MPSQNATDDNATPAKPRTPTTPSTPRLNSIPKRPPNGTPSGRAAQKTRTPNSAPVRAKMAGIKKAEPTLLGDFLLGRPSPARTRRKSLDLVKAEMKMASVSKVQQPGGVKDRVKQWQKASAAAVIEDPLASDKSETWNETDVGEQEDVDPEPENPKDDQVRPVQQDSEDTNENHASRQRSKSAPKKRVVSDDHWMSSKTTRKGRLDKSTKAGVALPKNFVHNNLANPPPLEKKIDDWAKRIASEEPSESPLEKEQEKKSPSKSPLFNDGIRVFPYRSPSVDDGIRIKPSRPSSTIDDGIRVRPMKEETSYGKEKRNQEEQRKLDSRNEMHLRSSEQTKSSREKTSEEEQSAGEEVGRTPSGRRRRRRSQRKSSAHTESLADVPVGYSAFSVLDLPLGADANAMRKAKPQRTGSLSAVPKVFKKVYTEGMKIMHDTTDPPPRVGVNQPPSIESWLNSTTDPFIDGPLNPVPTKEPVIFKSQENTDSTPILQRDSEEPPKASSRTHRQHSPKQKTEESSEVKRPHNDETKLPKLGLESSSPKVPDQRGNNHQTGSGLKRTPAKRTASSPRKSPLKEVLVDAFMGESEMYMPKSSSKSPPDTPKKLRVIDFSGSPKDMRRDPRKPSTESSRKSHYMPDISRLDKYEDGTMDLNRSHSRRDMSKSGRPHLSTIASLETLTTMKSIPETSSELSQTTITQTTSRTATSYTDISYTGTTSVAPTASNVSRQPSNKSALKRRLTKHSDLISVLSLPDSAGPTRGKSIRSARSIRTPRNKLSTATIDDLLKELATDESKYMRELRTLVDGVIPVLLTSVLSQSSSAIAAGLFDPSLGEKADTAVTKPIVDMGVALERLRSLHKRIPLKDTKSLVQWAYGANKVYEDYLTAWRMGFQDIVVNLAPASRPASYSDDIALRDNLLPSTAGDIVDTDGERADVAFLLKRPLIRIKYLLRLFEGLSGCGELSPSTKALAMDTSKKFQASKERAQRRVSEEAARLEDQAANNIDASLVRDPRTLNPLDDIKINRTRQVAAMDEFTLDIYHSTGQSLNCRAQLILRDKPKDDSDMGDLLICETDELKRWLLFPPIALNHVSARLGNGMGEIVIMVRGIEGIVEWHELLTLTTEDEDTVSYWKSLLKSEPVPGPTQLPVQALIDPATLPRRTPTIKDFDLECLPARPPSPCESEYPIGTRVKRIDSQLKSPHESESNIQPLPSGSSSMFARFQNKFRSSPKARDHIEVSDHSPTLLKRNKALNHSRSNSDTINTRSQRLTDPERRTDRKPSYERPDSPDETLLPARPILNNQRRPSTPSRELPYIPKRRSTTPPTSSFDASNKDSFSSSPLKESMRPDDLLSTSKNVEPPMPTAETDSLKEDSAPPPPVHRVLSPVNLKQTPQLDPPTTKSKTRRSSSPLKHEYQPSVASDDDSSFDATSTSDESYTDSSEYSDEDSGSEFFEEATPTPPITKLHEPLPESTFTLSSTSIAPFNSASQILPDVHPSQPAIQALKFVAQLYHWDDRGRWEKLHPDVTSVEVTPGQVEVFVMSATHSTSNRNPELSANNDPIFIINEEAERPLLAFDLTPWVPMRKSNATDVDVRSPPLPRSILHPPGHVMFRSINTEECWALYNALNHSRSNNLRYQQLAQEALLNSYGNNAYENAVAGNRRRTWLFGRKKSYRAHTRAPSETNESSSSFKSSFSVLLRGGTGFNIAKSRIERQEGFISGQGSLYGSSDSTSYGFTPPLTPSSPGSLATGNTISSNHAVNLGTANIKIRLHRFEGRGKWTDLSYCHLTISPPPPGRRQASSLNNGIEKHVLITTKPKLVDRSIPELGYQDPIGILDVVLGSRCFRVEGKTGILVNIWEDVMLKATGGVAGTTRKWMVQMATEAERRWVFGLLGNGIL